jgi:hypothetical protein
VLKNKGKSIAETRQVNKPEATCSLSIFANDFAPFLLKRSELSVGR